MLNAMYEATHTIITLKNPFTLNSPDNSVNIGRCSTSSTYFSSVRAKHNQQDIKHSGPDDFTVCTEIRACKKKNDNNSQDYRNKQKIRAEFSPSGFRTVCYCSL